MNFQPTYNWTKENYVNPNTEQTVTAPSRGTDTIATLLQAALVFITIIGAGIQIYDAIQERIKRR